MTITSENACTTKLCEKVPPLVRCGDQIKIVSAEKDDDDLKSYIAHIKDEKAKYLPTEAWKSDFRYFLRIRPPPVFINTQFAIPRERNNQEND